MIIGGVTTTNHHRWWRVTTINDHLSLVGDCATGATGERGERGRQGPRLQGAEVTRAAYVLKQRVVVHAAELRQRQTTEKARLKKLQPFQQASKKLPFQQGQRRTFRTARCQGEADSQHGRPTKTKKARCMALARHGRGRKPGTAERRAGLHKLVVVARVLVAAAPDGVRAVGAGTPMHPLLGAARLRLWSRCV